MKLISQLAVTISVLPFLMMAVFAVVELDDLQTGSWGGKHISLEITDNGGTLEFDCAHATIEGKLKPNQQGHFNGMGTYVEEHGGPVRQSEKQTSYKVLYTGQIKGETMKLTIKRSDTKKVIGVFNLKRGAEAFIVKCR